MTQCQVVAECNQVENSTLDSCVVIHAVRTPMAHLHHCISFSPDAVNQLDEFVFYVVITGRLGSSEVTS